MHESSIWKPAEAEAIIPLLARLTDTAQARLDALEKVWGTLSLKKFDAVRGIAEDDLICLRWALRIEELGAIPVGFFVVDFPTNNPEVVLCWHQGEKIVTREYISRETSRYCRRTAAGVALRR